MLWHAKRTPQLIFGQAPAGQSGTRTFSQLTQPRVWRENWPAASFAPQTVVKAPRRQLVYVCVSVFVDTVCGRSRVCEFGCGALCSAVSPAGMHFNHIKCECEPQNTPPSLARSASISGCHVEIYERIKCTLLCLWDGAFYGVCSFVVFICIRILARCATSNQYICMAMSERVPRWKCI